MRARRRKITVDLNSELLEQAQRALGTKGIKETIDRALHDAVVADASRRTVVHLRTLDPVDIVGLRGEAWRE